MPCAAFAYANSTSHNNVVALLIKQFVPVFFNPSYVSCTRMGLKCCRCARDHNGVVCIVKQFEIPPGGGCMHEVTCVDI